MQFLKYVADDLRKKYQNDLSRVAVVFPNKRAGIFFDDYLIKEGETQPVWAPQYLTINDLFDSLTPLRKVDDIKAVCLLYQLFKQEAATQEGKEISLDFFYGWGAQLLSDFSDIDRSMVNVSDIFRTWSEIKNLETLTEEEQEHLKPLMDTLKSKSSLKEYFEEQWSKLVDIYTHLNESLKNDGEAYEGARQRQVIEGLKGGSILLPDRFDHYAFVGFNMLLPVEWNLFDWMNQAGKGLYYWDYDEIYAGQQSVLSFGKTMQNNIKNFGNELDAELFKNLESRETAIEFVAASSDSGQTRYASQWLKNNLTKEERRTAVVLCDETLLQPLVHSMPDEVQEVNITKGFPMTHTPAFAFVKEYFENEEKKSEDTEQKVLLQDLADKLQTQAQEEIKQNREETWMGQLTAESYFQCFTVVNRVKNFVENGTLAVKNHTLLSLLRQILSTLSIPFHGEPASGLQVMGMLETRNLDFDELLMLSVNDGIVPKRVSDRSFIPYDLRKYYHIMTGDEQSEVYAYNFFRLLQRSGHVTLVYNESTDGDKHCGEMSRFMLQILLQTKISVKCFSLKEKHANLEEEDKGLNEEESIKIMGQKELNLSASAMEDYIDCPMKYFFSHIANMKDQPELGDILPQNTFGSIFHRAAECIYKEYVGKGPISSQVLENLSKNVVKLKELIKDAFQYISKEDAKYFRECGGDQLYKVEEHEVEADVILNYLTHVLKYDAQLAKNSGLSIICTEANETAGLMEHTCINGKIDRVDQVDGNLRVVDYKTGRYDEKQMSAKKVDTLFDNNNKKYVMQTLLYELLYNLNHENKYAQPAIYFVQKIGNEKYDSAIKIDNDLSDKDTLENFQDELKNFVGKMRSQPLTYQTSQACEYCAYSLLCGKKK